MVTSSIQKVLKKNKIGIKIKMCPTHSQQLILNEMFDSYRRAFNFTIQYIDDVYTSYKQLEEPIESKCDGCGEERWIGFEKDNKKICGSCFMMKWSFISIRNELMGYKGNTQILQKDFPLLTHGGLYQGVVKDAQANYQGYIKKINQRKKSVEVMNKKIDEMQKTMSNVTSHYFYYNKEPQKMFCKCCGKEDDINLINDKKDEGLCKDCFRTFKIIQKTIKKRDQLKKPITRPDMKKNSMLFYASNLAFFNEDYTIKMVRPNTKERINIPTIIGEYQKKYIDMVFAEEKKKDIDLHKKANPRVNYSRGKYYFIYPYVKETEVFKDNESFYNYYKQNKPEIAVLSFGLNRPITCTIINSKKKMVCFGDGSIFNKKFIKEQNKNKIFNVLRKRYKDNNDFYKRKNKYSRKIGSSLFFHCYRVNHYLSYKIVNYLVENKIEYIVFRDLGKIKDFAYQGQQRKLLNQWSVCELQNMIQYKAEIKGINIFKAKYNQTNVLKCSKCGEETEDKTKILTEKLNNTNRFKCSKCGYDIDFYFNDCINLYNHLNGWEETMSRTQIKKEQS
jgi:IS605 OrfB family transposase